jgi:hypothetical protein
MMQECGQRLCSVPGYGFSYRACACDTASRLCVRPMVCWSAFSLVPPLGSARRFVRRLHSYYGRVRLLWPVHRRLRPPAFPARSLQNSARTVQRYPGSRPGGVSACQCLRRRGADLCLAIATWAVLPSAGRKASALRSWFSPLNGWPTLSPVNASLRPSRVAAHDSGAVWFAMPSPQRTFTSYLLPVSRRTRPPHHCPTAWRMRQIMRTFETRNSSVSRLPLTPPRPQAPAHESRRS